jgi:hypothetical protein
MNTYSMIPGALLGSECWILRNAFEPLFLLLAHHVSFHFPEYMSLAIPTFASMYGRVSSFVPLLGIRHFGESFAKIVRAPP